MEGNILGNRYELVQKIGGGGMAIVYKAKCKLLNRYVAIKVLRPEFISDEEFVSRFRIEAQAAASLSDPNIVSIYDVGQDDNMHYIVMEYVDGITLKEYITQNGSLNWKEATEIGIQICSAIEHAHKNHIIHRDIKPHNILITKDGVAKVTDFGIARAVTSSTITMVGSTIGSVHYFSPEQARGGFTDERSDIYSLGIVLYEMLTGRVPFDGDSPVGVAMKHIQSTPREVISINNNIPQGVNTIVMNAIKKEKNQRYQSANKMLDDLYKVLQNRDIEIVSTRIIGDSPTIRMPIVNNPDEYKVDKDIQMTSKKKDKLPTILAITISSIIMLAIGFFTVTKLLPFIGIGTADVNEFVVGDYVGKNFYEVKGSLSQSGIIAKELKRTYSDDIPKDIIITQNKVAGEKIKVGGYSNYIEFEVSNGPLLIKIPDLRKKDYRQAENDLKDAKLKSEIVEENSDNIAVGIVIRTEPPADVEVSEGTIVKIFKSAGPGERTTIVPDLTGKTRVEALKLLSDAYLSIGDIVPDNNSSLTDKIVRQEPKAGTSVKEHTSVNIYMLDSSKNTRNSFVTEVVELTNPQKYNDTIRVTIKVLPAKTGEEIYIMKDDIKMKRDFPLTFTAEIPANDITTIRVELDNVLYKEFKEVNSSITGV